MSQLLTVDRALRVLGSFTAHNADWGVSELSRASGLNKSQTQRILSTLAARGFLEIDPGSHRYRLGVRLVTLARLAEQTNVARPFLSALARECGESAVFCEPDGPYYRCAAAVDGPGPVRYSTIVGERFPGYGGGASGDAIFAYLPLDHVRSLFGDDLTRADGTAGESWEQLTQRYGEIRRRGIAIAYGDYDPQAASVAAPVIAQGAVIGAVTVLGPRERMTEKIESAVRPVAEAAAELSRVYEHGRSGDRDG